MILKFILQLPRICYNFHIVNKYQLISDPSDFTLPRFLKIIGTIYSRIINPKSIFTKTKASFAQRLASALIDLGPIYIKLGQTLSTRPDLVGEDVVSELKKLQDDLEPFDFKIVRDKIKKYFKKDLDEIFSYIDEAPVAAASIAQVHHAILSNGDEVAVKILRPDIKKYYQREMELLKSLAGVFMCCFPSARRLRLREVVKILETVMNSELSLCFEGAAASQIKDNFTGDDTVYIPKIYWQYTNNEMLTLEWIKGVSIYDYNQIKKYGHNLKDLARKMAIMFFNMTHRDGFFHADLHPGNIIIRPDGKIALVDFGIIGILPEQDRLAIVEILHAFLTKNYKKVAELHKQAGYIPKDVNIERFSMSCRIIAEPIAGLAIKDISIGNLLSKLFNLTEEYAMEVQPQLLLLQKSMMIIEGVGQSLDKDINMWKLAEPWIKKWAAKNISPEAKILQKLKQLISKIL